MNNTNFVATMFEAIFPLLNTAEVYIGKEPRPVTVGVFLCPNGTYRNGTDADGFQSG
jgi:hypothetical protein